MRPGWPKGTMKAPTVKLPAVKLLSGNHPPGGLPVPKMEGEAVVPQRMSASVDITWLVNDLVDRVAHVQQAVVLSHDGLLIAKSAGLSREDAEHLSAVAAGMHR